MNDKELAHYGVLGMKWGVRKARGSKAGKSTPSASSDRVDSKPKEQTSSRSNSFRDRPGNRRMSDNELRSRINRLNMEKQYKDLTASPPRAKNFMSQLMADSGKRAARTLANKAVDAGLSVLLSSAAKNAKNPGTKAFLDSMAATGKKNKNNN